MLSVRSLFALFSVLVGVNSALAHDTPSEVPFPYPSSAMYARPTYAVSPATPVELGTTIVALEQTRLQDVASVANAPLYVDNTDNTERHWICVQGIHKQSPVKLWFISSTLEQVTEVQMDPGMFTHPEACGKLSMHFSPVTLSRISTGMMMKDVLQDIGPASLKTEDGWHFWVSRRTYSYYGTDFTEYVWVGARTDDSGRVNRVFTTQLTQ